MDKLELRANIKFCFKLGKSFIETFEMIQKAYGEHAYGRTTVYDWYKRFKDGRTSIEDDDRCGRPSTSTNKEQCQLVQAYVRENRRSSIRHLSAFFEIAIGSVQTILHNLNMHRVCAKFVPKLLSDDQKTNRVVTCQDLLERYEEDTDMLKHIITGGESWIYVYDPLDRQQSSEWKSPRSPTLKRSRLERSAGKVMLISFFDYNGMVHVEYVPIGQKVNGKFYKSVLKRLRDSIRRKRPEMWTSGNWFLQHDNAPSHKCLLVTQYLVKHSVVTLPHPAYSPDLAPNDFSLFPTIKKGLKGRRFADIDDVKTATSTSLNELEQSFFQRTFQNLPNRWQRCIDVFGEYFE